MDPRDALDKTLKRFRIKGSEIAESSGITPQMLSKYRRKCKDMNSINAFSVLMALPPNAQDYFWACVRDKTPSDGYSTPNICPDPLLEFLAQLRIDLEFLQITQGVRGHDYSELDRELGLTELIEKMKQNYGNR